MKKLLKKRILPFLLILLLTSIIVPISLLVFFLLIISLVVSAFTCLFVGADVVNVTLNKIDKKLEETKWSIII